jgi:ribosomal protein S6
MEEKITKAYEISYLLKTEEDLGFVMKLLSDLGAEIVNESHTQETRLAYPVKKETRAYFGYLHFNLDPSLIEKLKTPLELNDKVLRFLIVTPPFLKTQVRREMPGERGATPVELRSELSNDALEEKLEQIKI